MKFFNKVVSKQFGELLVSKNILSGKDLQKALKRQKKKGKLIGQILMEEGLVNEEDLVKTLAIQYGCPYLALKNYVLDTDVLGIIPVQVARHYYLVPIDKIADVLTVVMANPLNVFAIKDIEQMTKMEVKVFVSKASDINEAIEKYYRESIKSSYRQKTKDELCKIIFSAANNSVYSSKS